MQNHVRIQLIKQIQALLARLTEDQFLQFCQLYYSEVYYRIFTTGMTQGQRERLLIERAEKEQSLSELPTLLQNTSFTEETPTQTAWDNFPLTAVPNVGVLPIGSEMPLPVNRTFVGRQDELMQLAQVLHGGATAVVGETTASVTGAGGIGKTQLAAAFVHRYGQYFTGGVYWLNFSQAQSISNEIGNCVGAVSMPRDLFFQLPEPERVQHVLQAWQAPTPRLLIFDNCEDPRLLAKWQPRTGGCRILVTSRHSAWERGMGITAVSLDTLPLTDSVMLLQQLASHLTSSEAETVADAVGRFPLALYLAGSYLGLYGKRPLGLFLEQLQQQKLAHKALEGHGLHYSPTGHVLSVSATFALSWGQLQLDDPMDAKAIELLVMAGQFAPDEPIPELLVQIPLPAEDTDLIEEGWHRLRQLGFLPAGTVQVHRLITLFVREQVGEARREQVQLEVETAVDAEMSRLNKAGYPAALRPWLAHLIYLVGQALPRRDEQSAKLANRLGYHLHVDGDYEGARPYYQQALDISLEVLGEKHPSTASSLNNMGGLLDSMGDYEGARPYYQQALDISLEVLGEKHPDTALSLNNMGFLLQAMGDYEGARPYYQQALDIFEQILGVNHPHTKIVRGNLQALQLQSKKKWWQFGK